MSRLLLVDDDRLVLATVSEGLRDHGYEVVTAASGEEAIDQVTLIAPDLAILDMRMPGLSGVETARILKQQSAIPFMFLSAYGDEEIVKQATTEGALGYLVKPMDVAKMIPTIESALARSREMQELRVNEGRLQHALTQNRETSMAIGLVMERYHLNRDQAFDALRNHARSQRRKLEEVAAEMLVSVEKGLLPAAVLERVRENKNNRNN